MSALREDVIGDAAALVKWLTSEANTRREGDAFVAGCYDQAVEYVNNLTAALASQAARMAELEAIQRVAQDFDSNERLGDADFWWNVAAMRAVELARQVDRAEAAEAKLDALLHGAAK